MNRLIVKEYISKMSKDDINNLCKKNNYLLSQNDLDIIYYYIKNENDRFINDPLMVINEIKSKVTENTYNHILNLYYKYKHFIDKL